MGMDTKNSKTWAWIRRKRKSYFKKIIIKKIRRMKKKIMLQRNRRRKKSYFRKIRRKRKSYFKKNRRKKKSYFKNQKEGKKSYFKNGGTGKTYFKKQKEERIMRHGSLKPQVVGLDPENPRTGAGIPRTPGRGHGSIEFQGMGMDI
jgi:hypothetical protein